MSQTIIWAIRGGIPQQDPPCATAKAGELSNSNDLLLRSILLNVQKSVDENNQLLRTFKPLASHDRSDSQEVINLASNEAHSSSTQMAPTPASQEATMPALQEAIALTNTDSDRPRNAEDAATAALSIFRANDLNE